MTEPQQHWLPGTTEDLVEDARQLGVQQVSPRLVKDYVEVGLLASPQPRKSTQRGSDPRVFPPEQRRLFSELMKARRHSPLGRVPYRTMMPIVIQMWLTSPLGASVIPVNQARRALRTWAEETGLHSIASRKKSSRAVIEQFAHPTATRNQRRLVEHLLQEGERTKQPRWDLLTEALKDLSSPWRAHARAYGLHGTERRIGPAVTPMSVDVAVAQWRFHWEVNQQLKAESVKAKELLYARELHRRAWAGYQQRRPALMAQAGEQAAYFATPDSTEQQIRKEVGAFTTTLGHVLGVDAGPRVPG
ncbi:hypothetical protein [Streptomyces sp. R33]|uniref:Uncharacterized protein n=1 Tax=Streptomyces sp. R33 TaxID=3238629 RepID=A0AB39YJQ4_9ACTN